ncbi:hypothetical protein SAMN05660642_00278 [Geodermatophilus siccatus]|uniref:Uncharacterized protein n=1 Tax=Geodermatophilus siccatus TaxID=1137991 RepID=A0A1G9L581_9ACTN|nr:hypothetical protein [Geodermatophilus siccatus]SDL57024.1 hypothetical protein SAMN05660642_00278 [Geodermatophilus siccatus]
MGDREGELRASYRGLVAELEALLYRHDPVGIAFGDNPDEYAPEAGTIAVRLQDARTVDDVRAVVHAEFVRWFDEDTAGPVERYHRVAEEIWTLLGRR